jgi:DnaJ-class molecular chaperone
MWFKNIESLEQLKRRFRELANEHHPDKGGKHEVFIAIKKEYEEAVKNISITQFNSTYVKEIVKSYNSGFLSSKNIKFMLNDEEFKELERMYPDIYLLITLESL